jgi:hypothetical protein
VQRPAVEEASSSNTQQLCQQQQLELRSVPVRFQGVWHLRRTRTLIIVFHELDCATFEKDARSRAIKLMRDESYALSDDSLSFQFTSENDDMSILAGVGKASDHDVCFSRMLATKTCNETVLLMLGTLQTPHAAGIQNFFAHVICGIGATKWRLSSLGGAEDHSSCGGDTCHSMRHGTVHWTMFFGLITLSMSMSCRYPLIKARGVALSPAISAAMDDGRAAKHS